MVKRAHSLCDVCECEIANIDLFNEPDVGYTICRSPECRGIIQRGLLLPANMFEAHLKFNKKMLRDRRERQDLKSKFLQKIEDKEKQELSDVRKRVITQFESIHDDTVFLTIPSSSPVSKKIDNPRKREYIEHIKNIIRSALRSSETSSMDDEQDKAFLNSSKLNLLFESQPDLQALSDQLCSMCKGGCCASGNNHAYLSPQNVRRYLHKHPDATPVDLFKLYLSHINIESVDNACINQGSTGCSLPRELRADICNAFYCDSLERLHKQNIEDQAINAVVAIQRSSTYWNRFDENVDNRIIDIAIVTENSHESVIDAI